MPVPEVYDAPYLLLMAFATLQCRICSFKLYLCFAWNTGKFREQV